MTKNEFYEKIKEAEEKNFGNDLFVIMAAGYTEQEAEKANFAFEMLEFDWQQQQYVWLYDWDEGENFIKLHGIYTGEEIIDIIRDYELFHIF